MLGGLLLVGLLAAASQDTSVAKEYSCNYRKPCFLSNVTLLSEADFNEVSFPNISDPLTIATGKIAHLTRQLAEKFGDIEDLTLNNLELETVYVKPNWMHLDAADNRINTLLTDDDKERKYELKSLKLTNNKLRNVAVLSRFTNLHILTLDANELQDVSMDIFAGMTELRELSLANNELYAVETHRSFHLVKLSSLSFAGNKMYEIDMQRWELPSLKNLDLSKNQLYMLHGSLAQFAELQSVKISENFWKCENLMNISRLENVSFDADDNDRCNGKDLIDIRKICCTADASNILETSADGDLGLFSQKWEELNKLHEAVQKMNETMLNQTEKIDDTVAAKEAALEERIEQLEQQQKELMERLDSKEKSDAIEETTELREVVSYHKATIEKLENKQSELTDDLEGFVERLNSLRERVEEKIEIVDSVSEKIAHIEELLENSTSTDYVNKSISRLEGSFKKLEAQQIKYHLSSVELKSQINSERSKINEIHQLYGKLSKETELLRDHVAQAQDDIKIAYKILQEVVTEDE